MGYYWDYMGGHYAGALAYADKITLIWPSMTVLREND